ncbi:AraC family transcriptional regulator (plasmid) [Rhizobium ruizarguesonis]|nr:AraC family transcriptional regulator [Rhizobium ruizarguesonis]
MNTLSMLHDAVVAAFAAHGNGSPYFTAIDGLALLRSFSERHPNHLIHRPALCIVVQGAKWTTFGERRLHYRTSQAMVVSVEMPGASQVVHGAPDAPYLSAVIELDQATLREVYESMEAPPTPASDEHAAAFVMELNEAILGCAARAVSLLGEPQAIPLLYPGVKRELCYRLLAGPHGGVFARMVVGAERNRRLVEAIHALRGNFDKQVRVDDLAALAGLSPTAFHRQFKAMTAMTPVQFQKQIRLMEARRLMLSREMSAETVAFEVGYASPSQFSREYARLFGAPPRRDIGKLLSA